MPTLRRRWALALVPGFLACASSTDPDARNTPLQGRREQTIAAAAGLSVSPIFASNMVLQRGAPVPVFGAADPGTTVTVQFQSQSVSAVAASDGKWQATLATMSASPVPGTMTITSGTSVITLSAVQVGEV